MKIRPLAEIERKEILEALYARGGSVKRTALALGVDKKTIYNKLKLYGIRPGDIRQEKRRQRSLNI